MATDYTYSDTHIIHARGFFSNVCYFLTLRSIEHCLCVQVNFVGFAHFIYSVFSLSLFTFVSNCYSFFFHLFSFHRLFARPTTTTTNYLLSLSSILLLLLLPPHTYRSLHFIVHFWMRKFLCVSICFKFHTTFLFLLLFFLSHSSISHACTQSLTSKVWQTEMYRINKPISHFLPWFFLH